MSRRVLIIDDEATASEALRRLLERHGFEVREENDSSRALATAKEFQPDCVILDYVMPRMHGGDVAWQLASDPVLRRTKVVVCSGVSGEEIQRQLPPARIPILPKPVDTEALLGLLGAHDGGGEGKRG